MVKILFDFVLELYCFARIKLIFDLVLAVVLGLLEGVSVIMLLPLLAFAGITGNQTSGMANMVEQYLGLSGVALPLVLLAYTGITAGQSWLQRYESILNVTIRETFDSFLGTSLYQSLAYARWSFFLTVKKADIAHILTTERMRVTVGTSFFLQLIATVVIAIIQIGIAFAMAPYLTLLIIGSGIILFCGMHLFIREARRMGMNISSFTGNLFSEVTEHLNGIKEVKSYGMEFSQVKNFEKHRKNVEKTFINFVKIQSQTAMLYKIGAAVFISIFYYTAIRIFQLDAQILLIVLVIFGRLWPRFSSFQESVQHVVMMLPAFQVVTELRDRCLAAREKAVQHSDSDPLDLRSGIRLSNVSFRYNANNERYAVKQASFFIPAGTTTAVVGVSGAGKSTLADLLLGLLIPEQGQILVDNEQLDDDNICLWRRSIGYVPQDAFLFNTSIRENLIWACPEAKEEEIWQALKFAAIDEFVRALPEKLDSVVGDRGLRLSGGERQRIVLARALLRKPALLILDEATSALDTENEKRIQRAVDDLRGKLTILIIAHRIFTIKNADQILVMEKGRIVERGSYQSFAANENSRFYKLACL